MKQVPPLNYPEGSQRDAVAEQRGNCPTCGRSWGGLAIKVCRKCGQALGRNDKYKMVPAGPGLFAIEHRSCENPTARGAKEKAS